MSHNDTQRHDVNVMTWCGDTVTVLRTSVPVTKEVKFKGKLSHHYQIRYYSDTVQLNGDVCLKEFLQKFPLLRIENFIYTNLYINSYITRMVLMILLCILNVQDDAVFHTY